MTQLELAEILLTLPTLCFEACPPLQAEPSRTGSLPSSSMPSSGAWLEAYDPRTILEQTWTQLSKAGSQSEGEAFAGRELKAYLGLDLPDRVDTVRQRWFWLCISSRVLEC